MTNDELKAHIDARMDDTNERIDKLYSLMPDTAQAMGQVTYIFSPDGPFHDISTKVQKHHAVYQKGKAVGGLLALLMSWVSWDTVKNHWWHK